MKILKIGTPNLPTIIIMKIEQFCIYNAILCLKVADRMANRVDPDQTAPFRGSLIWVCTVCSDLTAPIY